MELKKTPSFAEFKRYSITNFVRKASYRIKAYQPNCIISAAVKPQLEEAKNNFYQEWDEWLIGGYIDWAVPMNYTSNSDIFEKNIRIIKDNLPKKYLKKIMMGIGIYNQNYKSSLKKIEITKNYDLLGYSVFSYTSLKNNKSYSEKFNKLTIKKIDTKIMKNIKSPTGTKLSCKNWQIEAAYRMIQNNLDSDVAELPDQLIVYGGKGKAARDWKSYMAILKSLISLEPDETLLIQSGKPVGIAKTHRTSPRILIANSNIVPKWATWEKFNDLEEKGLMMYGQMTAGSWIYIGTQGILQGTYETFMAAAKKHWNIESLKRETCFDFWLRWNGRRTTISDKYGWRSFNLY